MNLSTVFFIAAFLLKMPCLSASEIQSSQISEADLEKKQNSISGIRWSKSMIGCVVS